MIGNDWNFLVLGPKEVDYEEKNSDFVKDYKSVKPLCCFLNEEVCGGEDDMGSKGVDEAHIATMGFF